MGKEWLYWGGGNGSKSTKKERSRRAERTTHGCMCAVFQLFDLHQFQFAFHHHTSLKTNDAPNFLHLQDEPSIVLRGVEAPRNSLEMEETCVNAVSLSSVIIKDEESLTIPVGIQIKTGSKLGKCGDYQDLFSECSSSSPGGGSKTPNLVARLMGLDLLPNPDSPSSSRLSSISNSKKNRQLLQSCSVSLPETPRISSASSSSSSRRSDHVEHRLSLQINKENNIINGDELEFTKSKKMAIRKSDIKAKQIKESVSRRRVGLDITNTIKNRGQRRDEHLVLLKPPKKLPSPETTPTCSPRLRILDPKNKGITKTKTSQVESNVLVKINKAQVLEEVQQKCKKAVRKEKPTRLASDAIRNKREEPFIRSTTTNKVNISDNKCKRSTPLSNQLVFPVRKDSSLPLTKLRHKQEKCIRNGTTSTSSSTTTTTTNVVGHEIPFQYVKKILKRTGIDNSTPVSLAKWFSHSHPLDPSIFHYIELFHPTTTTTVAAAYRCNRKLIFQLVNELLVEILKPYINPKPWINNAPTFSGRSQIMYGSELIEELCRKIKNFPLANCQVLEDIDALIGTDLRNFEMGKSLEAYEEVGEKIALEMERDIIETLVHETVFGLVV